MRNKNGDVYKKSVANFQLIVYPNRSFFIYEIRRKGFLEGLIQSEVMHDYDSAFQKGNKSFEEFLKSRDIPNIENACVKCNSTDIHNSEEICFRFDDSSGQEHTISNLMIMDCDGCGYSGFESMEYLKVFNVLSDLPQYANCPKEFLIETAKIILSIASRAYDNSDH